MKKKEKNLLPLNLQFFAEETGKGNDGDESENQNDSGNGEKTFTQKDVTAMMAKEKNEGRRSQLKSLGFANEQEALDALKELEDYRKSKKTKEENLENDVKTLSGDKQKAIERAEAAEQKLSCFTAGVNKDCIDDVLAIAKTKVTEDKSLDDVLSDMKKDNKYSSFFSTSSNNGTGSNPGHSNGHESNLGDFGKRLAEKSSGKKVDKSYFN